MIAQDIVQQGETIVSLSARLTGNPLDWLTIVRLNGLRAPYLTDEPRDWTLSPGDTVVYPAPRAPVQPPDVSVLAARSYKRDLRVENGDLVLSEGNLTTEVSLPNLRTALSRRLETTLGRHPFHPSYGSLLYTHVGKVADDPRLALARVDVRRALLRDPRVEACSVMAYWQHEVLTVDCQITPIPPGRTFQLRYSFR